MNHFACLATGALALALTSAAAAAQQQSGMVGSGPPEDLNLEVTVGEDGQLGLSQQEFALAHGGYYRVNFVCPEGLADEAGLTFDAPELLENAHLRVLSIAEPEISFYLQGLGFRGIECEGAGTARFSFHPMRPGTYPFTVTDAADPPHEATGQFVVE